MAITVNVNGIPSNGGGNNQNPPPPPPPSTPPPSQGGGIPNQPPQYVRPDFSPYAPQQSSASNNVALPTPDRLVNDVRAEISRRGIIMIPGTQNYATMMNAFRQNMYNQSVGQVDDRYAARIADIDSRRQSLMAEVKARLDNWRDASIAGATSQAEIDSINKRYNGFLTREERWINQSFQKEYIDADIQRNAQRPQAEERLAEAIQRLTDELSQGNKDSYLNNLRDKYREQIWRRDNAYTEEEVREASREASKIQQRMQRAMGGASPNAMKWLGVAGTLATTAINTGVQLDRLGIQEDYLGIDMASSVLNGNAFAAIRQENALKEQKNTAIYSGIGTAAGSVIGAAIGSLFAGVGSVPGYAIGGLLGGLVGTGIGHLGGHFANREMIIEDERTKVADLWRSEEQRMMQFNDLVMLYRGRYSNPNDIAGIRSSIINQTGDRDVQAVNEDGEKVEKPVGSVVGQIIASASQPNSEIWRRSDDNLDLYDLGFTAAEFANQAARRIKQRGFVAEDSLKNALYADALERVFSLNSGALAELSKYDRFGNNANQDFVNLAYTLSGLGTTGMRNGQWARSDEFLGYMSQAQRQQRSTFLTVDSSRAGRQIATGQAIFGDKFGAEALQGIQQINDRVQNPMGGFGQTLLYDVIQELYPETRGRIDLIEQAQFDPKKQNAIQQAYYRRIQAIYGGVDTTAGYLAMQELSGIKNPNVMMPIAKQLVKAGGLEAKQLDTSHNAESEASILNKGYTPDISQRMNSIADQQMKTLLTYQETITEVVKDILDKIETSVGERLQKAVDSLKD